MPGVEHITVALLHPRQPDRSPTAARPSSFNVRSVHPDHQYLEKTIMVLEGRFINELDIARVPQGGGDRRSG